MKFNDLSKKERLELYQQAHDTLGLSKTIIEKDWWVTAVLRALFSLPYAENLSFKRWYFIEQMLEFDRAFFRRYRYCR